jgi:hypothetical protein
VRNLPNPQIVCVARHDNCEVVGVHDAALIARGDTALPPIP